MSYRYRMIRCEKCLSPQGRKVETVHCQPSNQSPFYCMRHEKLKIDSFRMADAILEVRSLVEVGN